MAPNSEQLLRVAFEVEARVRSEIEAELQVFAAEAAAAAEAALLRTHLRTALEAVAAIAAEEAHQVDGGAAPRCGLNPALLDTSLEDMRAVADVFREAAGCREYLEAAQLRRHARASLEKEREKEERLAGRERKKAAKAPDMQPDVNTTLLTESGG
ncbi:hypothetical protein T492DRAFT_834734 [Pavlovales sp. CCMP2436]|nr:hypothetical protein T492DRAFT_834734 [Pavlovales sp. CCMP2436]